MSSSLTTKPVAAKPVASKWGKLMGFGTGRKRLIVAGLTLTAILIVFVIAVATTQNAKVGRQRQVPK